jgi:hypothetical protein
MALKARKTEHSGAKKGRGAFYGRKGEAKRASNRRRRDDDKRSVKDHGSSQT